MKKKVTSIFPLIREREKNLFDIRGKNLSAIGESIRHGNEKTHHLFKMLKVENG